MDHRASIDTLMSPQHLTSIPPGLCDVPQMLDYPEVNIPYVLARDYFSGAGEIVELGSFLGASASMFARGLSESTILADADKRERIHCVDIFSFTPSMAPFLRNSRWHEALKEGDDTLPIFWQHLDRYAAHVHATKGDVRDRTWCGKSIEILYVDVGHTEAIFDSILAQYFPCLIPGRSVVVHQDYGYVYPWIHFWMERLSEFFEEKAAFVNCSAAFLLKADIDVTEFKRVLTTPLSVEEKAALGMRAMERRGTGMPFLLQACAFAVLLAQIDGKEQAARFTDEIRAAAGGNGLVLQRLAEASALIERL